MQEGIVTPSQEMQKLLPEVADIQNFWVVICENKFENLQGLSFFVPILWNKPACIDPNKDSAKPFRLSCWHLIKGHGSPSSRSQYHIMIHPKAGIFGWEVHVFVWKNIQNQLMPAREVGTWCVFWDAGFFEGHELACQLANSSVLFCHCQTEMWLCLKLR